MLNKIVIKFMLLNLLWASVLISGLANAESAQTFSQLSFSKLSRDVQTTLSPFKDRWAGMDSTKQNKLVKGAKRWNALNPQQQSIAKSRYKAFSRMPQAQRDTAVRKLEHYQSLSPEKRLQVKSSFQSYKKMPSQQREQLRQQFKNQKESRHNSRMGGGGGGHRNGQRR
ncbi:MAG: DUF3106 domain-containing protein [Bermanella sp.]